MRVAVQVGGRLLKYRYATARVSSWIEMRMRAALTKNMVFPGLRLPQPPPTIARWASGQLERLAVHCCASFHACFTAHAQGHTYTQTHHHAHSLRKADPSPLPFHLAKPVPQALIPLAPGAPLA